MNSSESLYRTVMGNCDIMERNAEQMDPANRARQMAYINAAREYHRRVYEWCCLVDEYTRTGASYFSLMKPWRLFGDNPIRAKIDAAKAAMNAAEKRMLALEPS